MQVGTIGLIKAVDRFDLERGVEFSTYATPTIVGEIKRWFRDKGWSIRVPRRLQELRLSLVSATGELTQELGRSPTVSELAHRLSVGEDQILEGIESANAYSTVSLDAPDSASWAARASATRSAATTTRWPTSSSASRCARCWRRWPRASAASWCCGSSGR